MKKGSIQRHLNSPALQFKLTIINACCYRNCSRNHYMLKICAALAAELSSPSVKSFLNRLTSSRASANLRLAKEEYGSKGKKKNQRETP